MRVKGKRVLKNGMEAGYVYYSKEKKWKWRIIGKAKKSKRVQKGGTNINFGMLFKNNVLQIRSNTFRNIKNFVRNKDEKNIYEGIEPIITEFIRLYNDKRGFVNHFRKCRGNNLKSFDGKRQNYRCWAAKFAFIIIHVHNMSSIISNCKSKSKSNEDFEKEISNYINMPNFNIKNYFTDTSAIKQNIIDYSKQNYIKQNNKLLNQCIEEFKNIFDKIYS